MPFATSRPNHKNHTRNRMLVRNLKLLYRLQTSQYGVAVSDLAEEHGVCCRTVYRDLEALQDARFLIVEHQGRYRLVGSEAL